MRFLGQHKEPCFNSRPCEGATPFPPFNYTEKQVSIHAPVKERRPLCSIAFAVTVFQFTPL